MGSGSQKPVAESYRLFFESHCTRTHILDMDGQRQDGQHIFGQLHSGQGFLLQVDIEPIASEKLSIL